MSTFILHILFSGLMAFAPTPDGNEVDVLLLKPSDCTTHYHVSDGTALPPHKPLLLARAGSCTGDCPTRDTAIAQFLFADQSAATATDSLENAVSGGGAWELSSSELSLRKGTTTAANLPALSITNNARATVNGVPVSIPTTSGEREDFSWVASLGQVCPTCTLNSDVFAAQPPAVVVARFRLRAGKLFTYSVARIGDNVTPVKFQRLDGTGSVSSYSQAIASWAGADIEVTGDSIDFVEEKFNGDAGRTMHLTPDSNGKIEVALVNLPPFTPPATTSNPAPGVGKHFELYYELTTNPPAKEARLVPFAGAASSLGSYATVSWSAVHPQTALWSDLLNALRLNVGRGPEDRTLCPPTQIP